MYFAGSPANFVANAVHDYAKKSANKAEIKSQSKEKNTNLTFKNEITFRPQPLYNDAAINGAKKLDRFCLFIRSLSFLKRHDFHSIVENLCTSSMKDSMLCSQKQKIGLKIFTSNHLDYGVCIFKEHKLDKCCEVQIVLGLHLVL